MIRLKGFPFYILLDKQHMTMNMTQSKHLPARTAKVSALTLAMLLMQSNIAIAADDTNPNLQIIKNTANASYDVGSVEQSSTSNQVKVKSSALPEYGIELTQPLICLLYTSPSPRDRG